MGIPPAPRGAPQIEVTFDIDANGIVNVQAKDKGTGKEQRIQIRASGGLSATDIDKMIKDAEVHAVEDKKRKEGVEAKNHGEALLHSTEKTVAEHGSKVGDAERRAIEDAMAGLREALKGEDSGTIAAKTNELAQASIKLNEAISSQSQDDSGNSSRPSNNNKENIVDADFTEVDDEAGKKKSA